MVERYLDQFPVQRRCSGRWYSISVVAVGSIEMDIITDSVPLFILTTRREGKEINNTVPR